MTRGYRRGRGSAEGGAVLDRRPLHEAARRVRDGVLHTCPGLQRMIGAGARRGWVPPALWRRLHPAGHWTLHAPDGAPFTYASAAHDGLARHVVWTDLRDWEPTTHPVLFGLAARAEVFVDVGAYSGLYTILACLANPRLRAVAFEPNPEKGGQLRANLTANGLRDRVEVRPTALAARACRATLAVPADDSAASLRAPGTGDRVLGIEVERGDDVLAGLPVDLIKIDVEGFEAEVLRGMPVLLAARRPKIIAECLDEAALRALRGTAAEFGYRYVYHLGRDGPVEVRDRSPMECANHLLTTEPVVTD